MKRIWKATGFLSVLIVIVISFQFHSCVHEPIGLANLDTVCFETQVLPIFTSSCALSGCHDATTKRARFDATSYASIIKFVTPGNAGNSNIYSVISSANSSDMMPPSGHNPLTEQERTYIEVWIDQGAKDTQCSNDSTASDSTIVTSNCDTIGTMSFTTQVMPIISANCVVCHGTGQTYNLSNYTGVSSVANTKVSNTSMLLGVINHESGFPAMPQSEGELSYCDRRIIELWVEQGALNN